MLLNTHHPLHSKMRQKSCAALQPDAQLVTMVIFNNATRSQSLLLLCHSLNKLQTFHTNEGYGKNRSPGFQKVLTNNPTPRHPQTIHTQAHPAADQAHTSRSPKECTYLNPAPSTGCWNRSVEGSCRICSHDLKVK